jgi:hypothetical protein
MEPNRKEPAQHLLGLFPEMFAVEMWTEIRGVLLEQLL